MKGFEFHEPTTLNEACKLLAKSKGKARALAGGTDILVDIKKKRFKVLSLVNLKRIRGLNKITFTRKDGLKIGALVTWSQLLESSLVATHYPVLRQAAENMGSMQIRNIATLAGNICQASPAANGPIPLLLYEAECLIRSPSGRRVIPIESMFAGVQKNRLRSGEILTEIRIPTPVSNAQGVYHKFSPRKAMDLAIVGVGTLLRPTNGKFKEVRIALGSVAPKPFRAKKAEKVLVGKVIDEQLIWKAAVVAANQCAPITDIRGSKEYRLELVKELIFRAIKECLILAA